MSERFGNNNNNGGGGDEELYPAYALLAVAVLCSPFILWIAAKTSIIFARYSWMALVFVAQCVNSTVTFLSKLYQACVLILLVCAAFVAIYFYSTTVSQHRSLIKQTIEDAGAIVANKTSSAQLKMLRDFILPPQ